MKKQMTEESMQSVIEDVVKLKGGRLFHVRDARRAPELADMPDLLIFLPGMVAIVELKSQNREVTVGQRQVLDLLHSTNELFGGIVRPNPKYPGETSLDAFLDLIGGNR